MSNLHAYFNLKNQHAFTKVLDGARNTSSSATALNIGGARSWTRQEALSEHWVDVNAKDWLGRTVLHLACSSMEPYALEFVKLLLAFPGINVNIQDAESHWSALHRALYFGNVAASILLLQRSDTDSQLKDYEGYTAFDLYNSTIPGTRLDHTKHDGGLDLFTWGTNRNATLGHSDADDRNFPDQVIPSSPKSKDGLPVLERLEDLQVKRVYMSKLHTVVLTTESHSNLRACGFGSGGRLGPGQHTQYSLVPVSHCTAHITAVALGQDHTLALSSSGELFSWGSNRYSQLGYQVDQPAINPGATRIKEDLVQATPRKVQGPLRKLVVLKVAACRTASACVTSEGVYTWGTNGGQLGYDSNTSPTQIIPRSVPGIDGRVDDLSLTDLAMLCLLESRDVVCFRNNSHFKVHFPVSDFPPPYRPPHGSRTQIAKLTSCENTFGALSANGDVFTFSISTLSNDVRGTLRDRSKDSVKPICVWSTRKTFDPVKDIALGSDGELILATEHGHTFVRQRNTKGGSSGKAFKFYRIPYIHRILRVCANSSGSFAALRSNYRFQSIRLKGATFVESMMSIRPWIKHPYHRCAQQEPLNASPLQAEDDMDDDDTSGNVEHDVLIVRHMCSLLDADKSDEGPLSMPFADGADLLVQAGIAVPAHMAILAARSAPLRDLLAGRIDVIRASPIALKFRARKGKNDPSQLTLTGCHPLTALLLLDYFYSDNIAAIWDRRVGTAHANAFARHKVKITQIKAELKELSRLLALDALSKALEFTAKRQPASTLQEDLRRLWQSAPSLWKGDTVLHLADGSITCHSVLLRARSPFFQSFFDDPDWTFSRWDASHTITVEMRHLRYRTMLFVMEFLAYGEEQSLFGSLDFVESSDDYLIFIFEVMAAANELLLDRLIQLCSNAILPLVSLENAGIILGYGTYYHAPDLITSIHGFIARNLEALLESHFLDHIEPDLLKELALFVRAEQAIEYATTRSNILVDNVMARWADWLEQQDIPAPIIRTNRAVHSRELQKRSPSSFGKNKARRSESSPVLSTAVTAESKAVLKQSTPDDGIFTMDSVGEAVPALTIGPPLANISSPTPWKLQTVPNNRLDMRSILAEAESTKAKIAIPATPHKQLAEGAAPATVSSLMPKVSQRERRKGPQNVQSASPPPTQPGSSRSPWSNSDAPKTSTASTSTSWRTSSQPGAEKSTDTTSTPKSRTSVTPSKIAPTTPGLGPVFVPAKNPASPPRMSRKTSDGPAWTSPPVEVAESPSSSSVSFAAIQQQQHDQGHRHEAKSSLRDIQEEQRVSREEEEFMRWWMAEEQRVKHELETATAPGPAKRAGNQKRARRGRGGGHGFSQGNDGGRPGATPQ